MYVAVPVCLLTSPSGVPSSVNLSSTSSCAPLSQPRLPNSKGQPSSLKPSSIARRRYLPSAGLGYSGRTLLGMFKSYRRRAVELNSLRGWHR